MINITFLIIFLISTAFFIWSVKNKFSLAALGKSENRFDNVSKRFVSMLTYAFGQKRVIKGPFGINHAILFWSFLILVLLNFEFLLNGLFPAISFKLLPDAILYPLRGLFDIVSIFVLIAVIFATVRKIFFPLYPESRSFEGFFILGLIGILMVAYLGISGAEIYLGKYVVSAFTPISNYISSLYASYDNTSVESIKNILWWIHAIALLGFINFLPYSKHMHVLTAIPNCYFRPLEKPVIPERELFKKGETFGVNKVNELSWKDLFDSYTCTECGRCQDICPANNTGKPLNPRLLIHKIKENLLYNAQSIKSTGEPSISLIGEGDKQISEEELWSCVTCGACMEVCPVFIEHIPKTIKTRRYLVETEAKFPEELLNLFENLEQRSNPWGIAPSDRVKWASGIEVKEFEKDKTEYLLFVGCAGAFDSRSKQVTLALANILDKAGISWGVLGKNELCCGDSARRLGNEYLFEEMALKNIELFKEKGVKKIITQCPHCFTTLKNDYKQFDITLEVIHHSKFIDELIKNGKLELNSYASDLSSITFHDSCYLGRHNDIYDAPRNVLRTVSNEEIKEMKNNKDKSFCCGAGGGRMWLEEDIGDRINITRVKQAVDTGADTVCVSCPYCLTMFEDGIKDINNDDMKVLDIAEIVNKAIS